MMVVYSAAVAGAAASIAKPIAAAAKTVFFIAFPFALRVP
jgi:hypothetical protein